MAIERQLPANVLEFASGNTDLYVKFMDYWNHYRADNGAKTTFQTTDGEGKPISFADKEAMLNIALAKEIERIAGVKNVDNLPLEVWANNPMVAWAAFAVVNQLIDAVLPKTLMETIGIYADVRAIGYGDNAAFDVEPRDLFVVSKAGHGMGQAEIKKQFRGQVTITPEMHEMTVGVSMYKVLAGAESLAAFTAKAIRSMESQITVDAYNAFATAMAALPTTDANGRLKISGWSQDSFLELAERVSAWNGGQEAALVGTQRALQNVLPDDSNYRYTLDDHFVTLCFIKNAFGYNAYRLPQVADWETEFAVRLANDKLWIVSPTANKLVKVVLEGSTLSNTQGAFDSANLTQQATFYKMWAAGVATSSLAATIDLA